MKIVRYRLDDKIGYGKLCGQTQKVYPVDGDIFGDYTISGEGVDVHQVQLLAPVVPSKAVCVGLNYKDHIAEFGMATPESPVLFIKPTTAVIGPGEEIVRPALSQRVDYEAELAVVIGKTAKNVTPEQAWKYIFGYTCANDVTARDLQIPTGQWTIAKGFDTFLPVGPHIETELDPSALRVRAILNDTVKQDTNTKYLLFDVPYLISYISRIMTLLPGDLILTGTSSGIAPMVRGDQITVEIEGIGSLTNSVC